LRLLGIVRPRGMRLFLLPLAAAEWDTCTTMAFTKGATTTGSSFVTHTTDCIECDSRWAYVPPRDYPEGALRPVYKYYTAFPREVNTNRSMMYEVDHNPELAGVTDPLPMGHIPQVRHTYGYYEATYPYMNEHGVAFGESTAAATLWTLEPDGSGVWPDKKIESPEGFPLFAVSNLMQIALERCKTARCAIETMGKTAEKYGFYGEDPESGETLTVTDNSETWIFNIASADCDRKGNWDGPGAKMRAAWVGQRVPEGHVAVSPNLFTIKEIDPDDKENFMFAEKIHEVAVAKGLWDGKGLMNYAATWGPSPLTHVYLAGVPPVPRYMSMRLWRIYSRVAPSLKLQPHIDPWTFPFSVPVDKQLTRREIFELTRDHYEGTPFDMRLGVLAGPFGTPNRLEHGEGITKHHGEYPRAISIPRTAYSVVAEALPDHRAEKAATPGIAWVATDTPSTSVYVPFFATAKSEKLGPYQKGSRFQLTRESAWWAFNFLANWMEINYRDMSNIVIPTMQSVQDQVDAQSAAAEDAGSAEALTAAQETIQAEVVSKWWDLSDKLVAMFTDGYLNECAGQPLPQKRDAEGCQVSAGIGYPKEWLDMIGFNFDIRPHAVRPGPVIPPQPEMVVAEDSPKGAPWLVLPLEYPVTVEVPSLRAAVGAGIGPGTMAAVVAGVAVGFLAGRVTGRRAGGDDYRQL